MAPDGMCIYAIGDIHGEIKALERLLARIVEDGSGIEKRHMRRVIVFLGDYIDRGPNSRGVIECLRASPPTGFEYRLLLGNHEDALLYFLENPIDGAGWLNFGGIETLASYGIQAPIGIAGARRYQALRDQLFERMPVTHIQFLEDLELFVELGDYFFVHAGILPGRSLDRQRRDDLLWIREPFLSSQEQHEKIVVHGHSVVHYPEILSNRIGVDTGAYATYVLSTVVLYGSKKEIIQTEAISARY